MIYALPLRGLDPAGPGSRTRSSATSPCWARCPELSRSCSPRTPRRHARSCAGPSSEADGERRDPAGDRSFAAQDRAARVRSCSGRGAAAAQGDDAIMFAYGPVMLHEALGGGRATRQRGLGLAVVSMPWLNRFDQDWLHDSSTATSDVFVLEDHAPVGGLRDALAASSGRPRRRLRRGGLARLRNAGGGASGRTSSMARRSPSVSRRGSHRGGLMASLRAYVAQAAAFAETRGGCLRGSLLDSPSGGSRRSRCRSPGDATSGPTSGRSIELFQSDPIDLGYVLGRTPLAPLAMGALLVPFGGALAEPLMSLLYAASILSWFLAARRFGGGAALIMVVILLAYPGYGILFHELGSDSVFAAAFAGWSLLAVRVLERPTTSGFALLGSGVAVLTLVRPGNQVLVVLAVHGVRARRLVASACHLGSCVRRPGRGPSGGLDRAQRCALPHDYTIARGGNAFLFYRVVSRRSRSFARTMVPRPERSRVQSRAIFCPTRRTGPMA